MSPFVSPSVVLPITLRLVPTYKFSAIPAPPSTISAPVVALVLPVVSFRFVTPVTSSVPPTVVLPVACSIVVSPTVSVVPSNVKLASSPTAPLVPVTGILLSVKSLTVNVLTTTSPTPSGVIVILPSVSVDVIAFPSIRTLSISNCVPASTAPVMFTG